MPYFIKLDFQTSYIKSITKIYRHLKKSSKHKWKIDKNEIKLYYLYLKNMFETREQAEIFFKKELSDMPFLSFQVYGHDDDDTTDTDDSSDDGYSSDSDSDFNYKEYKAEFKTAGDDEKKVD